MSREDWDGAKAKTEEQKSLIDFKPPEPNNEKGTDQQTDLGKVMEVDDLPFQSLTIGQDKPKEEPLELTDLLVPPPVTASAMASVTADDTTEDTDEGLMQQELELQQRKAKIQTIQ